MEIKETVRSRLSLLSSAAVAAEAAAVVWPINIIRQQDDASI